MKDKSDKSLKAAETLIGTQQVFGFNASIHCSYYAVLQYMKFILNETGNHPIEYRKQKSEGGESSHKFIMEAIKARIENRYQADILEDDIRDLKNQRVKADYTQINLTEKTANKCKKQAENIIKKLNQQFEIL